MGKNVANSLVYGTVLCGFHDVIVLVDAQQIRKCYIPDEFSTILIYFYSKQLIFNNKNNIYKYEKMCCTCSNTTSKVNNLHCK